MTRPFTGWHMAAILITFFGIVISVNIFMARAAMGTFGGTVVENSYVASQKFNGWLDKAAAQEALGWSVASQLTADRRVVVTATKAGVPLQGAMVTAFVRHPLGRAPEQPLAFRAVAGQWQSVAPLPAGRWLVHLQIRQGQNSFQRIDTLQ